MSIRSLNICVAYDLCNFCLFFFNFLEAFKPIPLSATSTLDNRLFC